MQLGWKDFHRHALATEISQDNLNCSLDLYQHPGPGPGGHHLDGLGAVLVKDDGKYSEGEPDNMIPMPFVALPR